LAKIKLPVFGLKRQYAPLAVDKQSTTKLAGGENIFFLNVSPY